MLSDWLKKSLKKRKISQADLGRMLTQRLGRSIDHAAANKMANGLRAIAADELIEIENILGESAPGSRPDAHTGKPYYEEQFIFDVIETLFTQLPPTYFKQHSPKEIARLVILCLNEVQSNPNKKRTVETVISLFDKIYLLEAVDNDKRGTGGTDQT
jgi:hypothetical protein